MKATEAKLIDFLKKSPQFIIPIYQRTYSWTEKECKQLWDDIIRTGTNDEISAHFVGSIVYIEKGLYQVTSQSPLLVIDGQQRLTTITLLIAALAKYLDNLEEGTKEPVEGFSPRKLRNYYLLNPEEEGEKRYKLILSQTDKDSLISIVGEKHPPKEPSIRITNNYTLFEKLISDSQSEIEAICKGVAKLLVVDIALDRDQDNPQLIFESMNSTGRELTQADLIRNYILMRLEPELQTKLYENYWRPMEVEFGQEAYGQEFDGFIRHYLTVKTGGDIPKIDQVYEAFKKYSRTPDIEKNGVESLVSDIYSYSRYFCAMALGQEEEKDLKRAFFDLRELKVDVAFPLLLELYHDYVSQILTKDDFLKIVRLIESYVFRRVICDIPTNSMNKTFATFSKNLKKDKYLENVQATFALLKSYRRFPSDEDFKQRMKTCDLYNKTRARKYCLRRLENNDRKEPVPVDEYSIEHVMPQNENLSESWKKDLGPDWKQIQEKWLHTLGNLTLTAYNSEYSDKPFSEKRDNEKGFKMSPLLLNQDLGRREVWNEATIKDRAEILAQMAIRVWEGITLTEDIIAQYQQKSPSLEYSIDNYKHLKPGAVRDMFEAFRKEVLALDPCVSEVYTKLYIAYKAETNFVDVEPMSKSLRLTLNMKYPDVNDPKGVCRDITGIGKWGNGDVEINMISVSQLPYVMGLVRQSFDKQMSNGFE
ncbi:DUF262 and DUF1524 domain-containing protein [Methanospirillum hungatei]|uniref:DUF262 and DUF1524 domain-containing protein n=1 Tax=Methanospirillum hungatei TaxID=2203 RepID=UPI0026EF781B|nr:DUF262 and DUF1524 domain-containing protein [Methanospirillum hungatei]MCA1917727.1 DUF262 and DUF1524 domain-containing protein [Methanospirillum hungatei]